MYTVVFLQIIPAVLKIAIIEFIIILQQSFILNNLIQLISHVFLNTYRYLFKFLKQITLNKKFIFSNVYCLLSKLLAT
jgi:hypothetical protein